MNFGGNTRNLAVVIGAGAIVAGAWLAGAAGPAFAGKPPPPPPPATGRTIYFEFGLDPYVETLPPGATSPTALAGTWGSHWGTPSLSKEKFGGQLWQARRTNGSGTCPDGTPQNQILVSALDLTDAPVSFTDSNFQLWNVEFRPTENGGRPRVTFEGVHWYVDANSQSSVESGLFELELSQDAATGLIVGVFGSPALLLADAAPHTDSNGHLWPDIRPHTWITANTLAYGADIWDASGNFVGGELHTRTYDPATSTWGGPSAALTTDTNRALFALNASPNGGNLLFGNYQGCWEVPVSGGTVLCWIATKGTRKGEVRPECGDYVDDNTIAYNLHDIDTMGGSLSTSTLYRKTRSGTTTQLTKSTQPYAQMVHAR